MTSYTYELHGRWYAESLDLTLLAEADTQEQAIAKLTELIDSYVEDMADLGWPVRRPVGLDRRLAFYVRMALTLLGVRRSSLLTRT